MKLALILLAGIFLFCLCHVTVESAESDVAAKPEDAQLHSIVKRQIRRFGDDYEYGDYYDYDRDDRFGDDRFGDDNYEYDDRDYGRGGRRGFRRGGRRGIRRGGDYDDRDYDDRDYDDRDYDDSRGRFGRRNRRRFRN